MRYSTNLVALLSIVSLTTAQLIQPVIADLPPAIPIKGLLVETIIAASSGSVLVPVPGSDVFLPLVQIKEGAIMVPSVPEISKGSSVIVVEILPSQEASVPASLSASATASVSETSTDSASVSTPISVPVSAPTLGAVALPPNLPGQLLSPCLLGFVARLESNGTTSCIACGAHVQRCTISPDTGLTIAKRCNPLFLLAGAKCVSYRGHGPAITCRTGFSVISDPLTKTNGCGTCDSESGLCTILPAAMDWGDHTAPTFCAPGYSFSDGACSICGAGSFANFNATFCSNCTSGTYSTAGSAHCSNCAPGFVSLPQSSNCSLCTNGTYATPDLGCLTCLNSGVSTCSALNGTTLTCLPDFTLVNGTCTLPKITAPQAYIVKMNCRGATVATIKNKITSCTPCGFGVAACSSVDHSPTNILVLGCLAGFYYTDNKCTRCDFGNGSAFNNTESICSKCDNPAATRCSTKPLADIACTTGYYLRKRVCTICGPSASTTYDNSNPTCIHCPGKGTKDCDFNVHPVNILSCVSGYIYSVNGNVGACTALVN